MTVQDDVINHFFRNSAVSAPAAHWLALFTTIPTNEHTGAGGVEVVGGSYARQTLTLTAPSSGYTSNSTEIQYAGMPDCEVVYAAVYTLVSGGTFLRGGRLSLSRSVLAGQTFVVQVGTLNLRVW